MFDCIVKKQVDYKKTREVKPFPNTPEAFLYKLGSVAKDAVTGFSGIIVNRTQWLHNCNVYAIQPTELKADGSKRDLGYFDEPQIVLGEEYCGEVVVPQPQPEKRRPGGPASPVALANR